VTLKVKFADFELITRSRTLSSSVESRNDLESATVDLLRMAFPLEKAVRLLGVSISGISVQAIERSEQIIMAL